jgi:response regulator RpfG family c-di-GMP phosphodiesterase
MSAIETKIKKLKPNGGLEHTSKLLLSMAAVNHGSTKKHVERVAVLCEKVATRLNKDSKAAFFAGLFHDLGKILLPHKLFDGHEITNEEYQDIQTHAINGFKALRKQHMFTALCAGLHHNMFKHGYGIDQSCFPKNWSSGTIKKVLEISAIVSVCDFIDAFTHRKTKIRNGSGKSKNLKDMLYEKYPDDKLIIDTALSC